VLPPTNTHTLIIGVTQDHTIAQFHLPANPDSSTGTTLPPKLYAITPLPLASPPSFILPVDPMAWSSHAQLSTERDVLVSISSEGLLSFWIPEDVASEGSDENEREGGKWICTGSVHTGRKNIKLARCSSTKKTVLGKCFFPGASFLTSC
jgi:hypothetical protein